MDLSHRSVALYGRFSAGNRERLQREIAKRGGAVARDLTRRSDFLVVGALATALIDSGSLGRRLGTAKERQVPILGERSFASALEDEPAREATLPLATALAPTALSMEDARLLAAFDLIAIEDENCRFADAGVIRTANEFLSRRGSRAEMIRVLARASESAPAGRRKLVLTPSGQAVLQWDDGLTTLEGQGYLPFDAQEAGIDELFEQAELAEAGGDPEQAARLFDMCARADKSDAIAPFNLGNVRLAQGDPGEAVRAYQRALARDGDFIEARYNLALALEASDKLAQAAEELQRVLAREPTYSDALFNLAQVFVKSGRLTEAKASYERYLALDPPAEWAAKARRAIVYCTARLAG